jgi:glycerol-3-phosphate cytidylyltransferase-like family protein
MLYKRRPALDYELRTQTLRASGFADEVMEAPLSADAAFIERHDFDFVTHGSDWSEDSVDKYYGDAKRMNKLKIVPCTPGISTTDLIKRIIGRDDFQEEYGKKVE